MPKETIVKYGLLMDSMKMADGSTVYSQDGMIKGMHLAGNPTIKGKSKLEEGPPPSRKLPINTVKLGARPLTGGDYNLMGGDIIFQAHGKHALNAISLKLQDLNHVRVRFGSRGPYMVEVHDEHGDQKKQLVTEVARYKYYVYLSIWKTETPFKSAVTCIVSQLAGFAGAMAAAGLHPAEVQELTELQEGVKTAIEAVKTSIEAYSKFSELKEASEHAAPSTVRQRKLMLEILESDRVRMTFTSRKRDGDSSALIGEHTHTHPMPYFVKDVAQAIHELLSGKAAHA